MGPEKEVLPESLRAAGVTRRELAIFWLVADRLHNKEIADSLHVSERTVESHVSALLGKLHAPNRQALVEVGARLRDRSRVRASLPQPVSSFIGRAREVDELTSLVSAHRMVTLTGPAGVGKTRLALKLVAAVDSLPPAILVDLATVTSGDSLPRLFADALTVSAPESRLRSALRETLATGRCWLLVDNCEHVAHATASLLAELLSSTSQLHVLATSHGPLRIAGEAVYSVAPLPLPPDTDNAREVLAIASGRLFAERAAAALPGFTVNGANARDVAEVCRRLDGLPLAIELAAPRVRTFSPAELVVRMEDRFGLLTDGPAEASGRHVTLDTALRWSYELLDDAERVLLERCSVFPSEFDYDTVAEIAAYPPLERSELARLFPHLLDRSLISASRHGEATAYRMLDSIREFARAQLARRVLGEEVRQRHAMYHLSRGVALLEDLQGRDQLAALAWFNRRWADLRAAMRWVLDRQDIESAWRFVGGIGTGWDILGFRGELFSWLELMLQEPLPAGPNRAQSVATAVILLSHQDGARAVSIAEGFYASVDRADDRDLALAELSLGWALRFSGTPAPAVAHLQAAAARFELIHDLWHQALALQILGAAELDVSQDGIGSIAQAADLFGRLNDDVKRANCLLLMAALSINVGTRLAEVEGWIAEANRLAERTGNQHELLHAELWQARIDQLRAVDASTGPQFSRLLDGFRRIGDRRCVARCLVGLGRVVAAAGDHDSARRHLTEAALIAEAVGDQMELVAALRGIARLDQSVADFRHAAAVLGAADVASERIDEAHRTILPDVDDLRRKLEASGLSDALIEGRQASLKEILAR